MLTPHSTGSERRPFLGDSLAHPKRTDVHETAALPHTENATRPRPGSPCSPLALRHTPHAADASTLPSLWDPGGGGGPAPKAERRQRWPRPTPPHHFPELAVPRNVWPETQHGAADLRSGEEMSSWLLSILHLRQ